MTFFCILNNLDIELFSLCYVGAESAQIKLKLIRGTVLCLSPDVFKATQVPFPISSVDVASLT